MRFDGSAQHPPMSSERDQRHGRRPPRGARLAPHEHDHSMLVFAAFALLPLALAFNEGGLDLVVRQEVGIALVWSIAVGGAFGLLRPAHAGWPGRYAVLGLAVLVAWTAVSLLWSTSAERTLAEVARTLIYAAAVLGVFLTVGRRTWRPAAAGICAALLTLPVVAVLSRAVPGLFETGPLGDVGRLSFPLGYWNALAAWGAMAVAAGLSLSAHLRSPPLRALSLAAVPIAGLAVYLTFSRGGAMAVAVAVAVALSLSRHRLTLTAHAGAAGVSCATLILVARANPSVLDASEEGLWLPLLAGLAVAAGACGWVAAGTRRMGLDRRRVSPRTGTAIAAGVLAAGAIGAAVAGGSAASSAAEQFASDSYPSQEGDPAARLTSLEGARDELWASALGAFGSAPVTGLGAGTFEFWWTQDVPGGEALREPHSLYLGQLAELGLPGLVATLLALGALLAGAVLAASSAGSPTSRALLIALASAYAVFLVHAGVDWLWESTALAILALGSASVATVAGVSRRPSPRHRLAGWRLAALVVVAVLAGVAMVPGIVATERVRASYASLLIGRAGESARIADDAVRAQPWAATPYAARALARLAQGRKAAARADARRAIEREPDNWRHPLLLAGIAAASGDQGAAENALDRAAQLRPGRPLGSRAIVRRTGEERQPAP